MTTILKINKQRVSPYGYFKYMYCTVLIEEEELLILFLSNHPYVQQKTYVHAQMKFSLRNRFLILLRSDLYDIGFQLKLIVWDLDDVICKFTARVDSTDSIWLQSTRIDQNLETVGENLVCWCYRSICSVLCWWLVIYKLTVSIRRIKYRYLQIE